MRTATPTEFALSHADHVDPVTGVFEVTAEAGAVAAISNLGVLFGSAIADEAGLALIAFDPEVVGALQEVTLTVTGFNKVPSVALLPVQTTSTSVLATVDGVRIGQNRPNPFERSTGIELSLDRDNRVRLEIYDVAGRKVRTLQDGVMAAGSHQLVWDGSTDAGRSATAGTYFYRLVTENGSETRRMVRLQ
jgi:hypothetical protein